MSAVAPRTIVDRLGLYSVVGTDADPYRVEKIGPGYAVMLAADVRERPIDLPSDMRLVRARVTRRVLGAKP